MTGRKAEDELRDVLPAMFVGEGDAANSAAAGLDTADAYEDAEHAGADVLADVAAMTEVKQRLEAAFLAPMRNPDLQPAVRQVAVAARLLLYGPPGCSKTFIARAVAGELERARFIAVSFAGHHHRHVRGAERAEYPRAVRRSPPARNAASVRAVPGRGRRDRSRSALGCGTPRCASAVNQAAPGAGRHLERQQRGRVPAGGHEPPVGRGQARCSSAGPVRPDAAGPCRRTRPPARRCSGYHLRERPVAGIDLAKLAKQTDGSLRRRHRARICETAAEQALMDSSPAAASRG